MYGMDQFENELKELRIVLSDVQKQQFEEYYKLLVEWNEVMNLTAITDYKDVMKKHFFDSLTVVRAYPEILTEAVSVIDIGTGAGFPGIPLKIAVANLSTLSELCLPYVKENGKFIPYKAEKAEVEIEAAQKAVDLLGGEISDKIEFQLPGGDMGRTLVVIDKIKKTPKKYPRKAGTPAKMPIV